MILVAVSKAQPDARVIAALDAGQRVFGENYAGGEGALAGAQATTRTWSCT